MAAMRQLLETRRITTGKRNEFFVILVPLSYERLNGLKHPSRIQPLGRVVVAPGIETLLRSLAIACAVKAIMGRPYPSARSCLAAS